MRVVLVRTERTAEGVVYYRMRDLRLEHDRSPALARPWTVIHPIDPSSPLHGATPETLARDEVEFILTVVGIDETSAQNLHARQTYHHDQVRWGARHADMLPERPDVADAGISLPALTPPRATAASTTKHPAVRLDSLVSTLAIGARHGRWRGPAGRRPGRDPVAVPTCR